MRAIFLTLIALLVSLTILIVAFHYATVPNVSGFLGVKGNSATILQATLAFMTTILGVLLGALYRRLIALQKVGQKSIKLSSLLKTVVRSIDFQIGLVGAPIIFGLLWQAIKGSPVEAMLIIALQNGFASHALLKEVAPNMSDEAPLK